MQQFDGTVFQSVANFTIQFVHFWWKGKVRSLIPNEKNVVMLSFSVIYAEQHLDIRPVQH